MKSNRSKVDTLFNLRYNSKKDIPRSLPYISHFDVMLVCEEKVLTLEVTMDDAPVMEIGNTLCCLLEDLQLQPPIPDFS